MASKPWNWCVQPSRYLATILVFTYIYEIFISRSFRSCLLSYLLAQLGDPFDVVFMDCMMPVMDGPTAAREMKAVGR